MLHLEVAAHAQRPPDRPLEHIGVAERVFKVPHDKAQRSPDPDTEGKTALIMILILISRILRLEGTDHAALIPT